MKGGASTFNLFQDVGGLGGPDKWFGVVIVTVDVFSDGLDQFLYGAKDAAT